MDDSRFTLKELHAIMDAGKVIIDKRWGNRAYKTGNKYYFYNFDQKQTDSHIGFAVDDLKEHFTIIDRKLWEAVYDDK